VSRRRARPLRDAVPYVGRNWIIGGRGGYGHAQNEMREWRMRVGFGPFRRTRSISATPGPVTCLATSPRQVYAFVLRTMPGADLSYGFVMDDTRTVLFRNAIGNCWLHFNVEPHADGLRVCCDQKRSSFAQGRRLNHEEISEFLRDVAHQ